MHMTGIPFEEECTGITPVVPCLCMHKYLVSKETSASQMMLIRRMMMMMMMRMMMMVMMAMMMVMMMMMMMWRVCSI